MENDEFLKLKKQAIKNSDFNLDSFIGMSKKYQYIGRCPIDDLLE
jgi:hypothetical protein